MVGNSYPQKLIPTKFNPRNIVTTKICTFMVYFKVTSGAHAYRSCDTNTNHELLHLTDSKELQYS